MQYKTEKKGQRRNNKGPSIQLGFRWDKQRLPIENFQAKAPERNLSSESSFATTPLRKVLSEVPKRTCQHESYETMKRRFPNTFPNRKSLNEGS